jgi:hypothetical protein
VRRPMAMVARAGESSTMVTVATGVPSAALRGAAQDDVERLAAFELVVGERVDGDAAVVAPAAKGRTPPSGR